MPVHGGRSAGGVRAGALERGGPRPRVRWALERGGPRPRERVALEQGRPRPRGRVALERGGPYSRGIPSCRPGGPRGPPGSWSCMCFRCVSLFVIRVFCGF
jgi:hypothetical protein